MHTDTSYHRFWVFIGSGVNQFFSLRYPAVHIVSIVAELLAYPMGVALAYMLPIFTVPLPFGLGTWEANPNRTFNIKEHVVIVSRENTAACCNALSVASSARKAF